MVSMPALWLSAALLTAGETTLLQFSSEFCGPCQAMAPTMRRLASEGYPLHHLDVKQHPQWAQTFRVNSVPCFVMVKNGAEVGRLIGPQSYDDLRRLYESAGVRPARRNGPAPHASQATATAQATPEHRGPALPAASSAWTQTPRGPSGAALPAAIHPAVLQRALGSAVRLRVEDARGYGCGAGCVIDTHRDEALVLTCGHLFRDSQGQGKITVEVFTPSGPVSAPGRLLAYQAGDRDIALLTFRPPVAILPSRVADAYAPRQGQPVFSVGCDHGAPPTIRQTHLTAVNKYVGAPNLEAAGQPVEGRSGGGLFNAQGELIGVCNAADPTDNEGIYAALETVHWQLRQVGLEGVFRNASAESVARQEPPRQDNSRQDNSRQDNSRQESSRQDIARQDGVRQPLAPPAKSLAAAPELTPAGRLLGGPASSRQSASAANPPNDMELFFILRPKTSASEKGEAILLRQPSPELLELIQREYQRQQAPPTGPLQAARPALRPETLNGGALNGGALETAAPPVIRAQSAP